MIEECKEENKKKKEKKSSTDMIDSFFGSHDFNTASQDQDTNRNFQETEQLIDKLLDDKSSNDKQVKTFEAGKDRLIEEKQDESLTPSVNVFDHTEKESIIQDESIEEKYQKWNPVTESHEKEEIFEIDQPETPSNENLPKERTTDNKQKKQIFKNFKLKNNEDSKKDVKKKKTFSFHLPKINLNLNKSIDHQQKKTNDQSRDKEKKSEDNLFLNTKKSHLETKECIPEFSTVEKNEFDAENKKEAFGKPIEKKKKPFFKSSNDTFHFFKKSGKNQASNESESQNQKERIDSKTNERQIQSQKTTSDGLIDEEVIKLLKITDDLLGKLPEEVIEEFSQSDDFTLYEKIMKKYEILK